MKKVTRTVITHNITLGYVEDRQVHEVETRIVSDLPKARELSALSKEYGKSIIVISDEPIETTFGMSLEDFIAHSTIVEGKNKETE